MKKNILFGLALASLVQLLPHSVKAVSFTPNRDSASYFFNLGKEEEAARKFSNAWRYYEKATNYDPSNVEAYVSVANVCLKMNKMAPAIKALEEVNKVRPADNEVLWRLTQLYFTYSQWDKVIEYAPKVHQQMPEIKGTAFMLGKAYFHNQNYGKGLQYLQTAIKEEPGNAEAFYLMGHMYAKMSNYKPAIPYYEQALALDTVTSYHQRMYEFALVLSTASEFDASIKWFKKAIESGYKPRDDFYMNMANTLADAKKTDEAIAMMEEILSRKPMDLELMTALADINYHSGRYKQAISYWDKIWSYDEKNGRPLYQIGLCYLKLGDKENGQKLCDQAIAMDPSLAVLRHEKRR